MLLRAAAGAFLACAVVFMATSGAARADAASGGRGVVVVAVGDDATPAARPLALAVYRDAGLRPAVDDATARILVGEPAAEDAAPKLKDLAALRASLARPTDAAGEGDPAVTGEVVTRRLLASMGGEAHAALVVAVTMRAGRPSARALRVATSAYEGVEIGATASTAADGTVSFTWPGAVLTLHTLLPQESAAPARAAAAPRKAVSKAPPARDTSDKPKDRSLWSSPWFWVGLGAVVATGVTVFVVTNEVKDDGGTVHLDGRVPR